MTCQNTLMAFLTKSLSSRRNTSITSAHHPTSKNPNPDPLTNLQAETSLSPTHPLTLPLSPFRLLLPFPPIKPPTLPRPKPPNRSSKPTPQPPPSRTPLRGADSPARPTASKHHHPRCRGSQNPRSRPPCKRADSARTRGPVRWSGTSRAPTAGGTWARRAA